MTETDQATFERFLAAAEDDLAETNPDEVTLDIIKRILRSADVDEVLEGASATHAEDMLGVPFALTDVRFNRSSFDGAGPAFYALLTGADAQGEKVTITCGARNVIAQAWKLKDMGALPVLVEIQQSERPTAAGYKPMWLAKPEKAF